MQSGRHKYVGRELSRKKVREIGRQDAEKWASRESATQAKTQADNEEKPATELQV
jgi:hypothetical protein